MRPMQLETSVYEMAVVYFRICIGFSVLQGIISAISAVLRSYGKPKLAVTVSLFMNIVNAVLNYVVIFQPVKIVPEGVEGIAMANVASHGTALLLGVWFLFHCGLHLDLHRKFKDIILRGWNLKDRTAGRDQFPVVFLFTDRVNIDLSSAWNSGAHRKDLCFIHRVLCLCDRNVTRAFHRDPDGMDDGCKGV